MFRDMMGEGAGHLLPCIDALSNLCLSAELQSAVVEAALGRLQARKTKGGGLWGLLPHVPVGTPVRSARLLKC